MSPTKSFATLAVGALAAGIPAAALRAQPAPTPAAIACGFLLRQGPRVGGMVADSVRRLADLQRLVMIQRGQPGAAGDRIRLERTRGWIGVQMTEVSETRVTSDGRLVRYCDYPVVVSVEPASPAARAGLESGDTVWAYNGVDLRNSGEVALDRLLVPDDTLRLGVRRNGHTLDLPVIVARRPDAPGTLAWAPAASGQMGYSFVVVTPTPRTATTLPGTPPPPSAPVAARSPDEAPRARMARRSVEPTLAPMPPLPPTAPMLLTLGYGSSAFAGAQLVAMDDDLRAVVGAKRAGVLVLRVADGSPASEAGLRAGDVIISANGRATTAPAALMQTFQREGDARVMQLRVERKGKGRDVAIRW